MNRIAIRNGHVVDPSSRVDGVRDLFIASGRIVALGEAPEGFTPEIEIEAAGRMVCPGLVDLSARLREPGHEQKATIASETRAAVSGGVTTVCCPPDTSPVIDTPAVAELVRHRAKQSGRAWVLTLGALTQGLEGEQLAEMAALKAEGCVGVSNAGRPIRNSEVLRRALEYAATYGLTVYLQPRDPWLGQSGFMHEGSVSTRLGLPGIPETSETVELARCLLLIEQTGVRAHFCRLSTARSVEMVADARARGLRVTADVAAHQLHLTEMDVAGFDPMFHVIPPLRTIRDRDALRAGVAEGVITAVCSDHQPHEPETKLAPFNGTLPGISALETLLPLTLRLVDEGAFDLGTALARVTRGPAEILGIETGTLTPGTRADLCVIDTEHAWRLDPDTLLSRGRNTPFRGWEFRGRVTHTLVQGRLVYELR